MNKVTMVLLVVLMAAISVACEESAMIISPDLTVTPAVTPSPTLVDPAERATAEAVQATSAVQTQAALDIQHYQAEATLAAAEIYAEQIRAQQTAIVEGTRAAATQISVQMTEAAAQITRAAEATSTERAWLAQGWTATADAAQSTGTAEAAAAIWAIQVSQTQQAANALSTQAGGTAAAAQAMTDRQATMDAASVMAGQTAVAAQAAEAENAAERSRMTNQFYAWWWFWFPAALLIIGGLLWMLGRKTAFQNQVISRDGRGASPVVILDGELINPDTMVYPKLSDSSSVSEETQAGIAEAHQKVSAVRAEIDAGVQRRMVRQIAGGGQKPQGFRLVNPQERDAQKLLPKDVADALEADWQEAE